MLEFLKLLAQYQCLLVVCLANCPLHKAIELGYLVCLTPNTYNASTGTIVGWPARIA
jgi:hypothetical protein